MAKTITYSRIRRWGACLEDVARAKRLYPDGIPLTYEAANRLRQAGCDVMWGLVRLLNKQQRQEFILFTLRQRQPHVASLLRRAGLEEHAKRVEALRFETVRDARAAEPVLRAAGDAAWDARDAAGDAAWDARDAAGDAAWDARDAARDARDAWDAAWDAQVRWCLEALGVYEPVEVPEARDA